MISEPSVLMDVSSASDGLKSSWGRQRVAGAVVLAILTIVMCARMYGHYLFDDSFFGFSYAKNLAEGHGFVFNPGERFLGTSAPLVVPVYAFLYWAFHWPIENVAQIGSFIAIVAGAISLYTILSEDGNLLGAFFGAFIFATSPLITLVVSHETVLYLGLGLVGAALLFAGRPGWAGLVIALATLCRMEAVTLGFCGAVYLLWLGDRKGLARYLGFAALVILPWVAFATWYFGTPLSSTVKAKQLQVLYGNTPYLQGAPGWIHNLYRPRGVVASLVALAVLALGAMRRLDARIAVLLGWVTLQSLIYVVLKEPFYHWFIAQLSIPLALMVWAAWRSFQPTARMAKAAKIAVALVASLLVAGHQVTAILGDHARVQDAPYYRLAQWIKRNTKPTDKVAYLEIGMLKFYSERFIVDWLGLVTPGVVQKLARGNVSWVVCKYRPDVFIQNDLFNAYLDAEQYPWFQRAYRLEATLSNIGYPIPLKIYRLADPSAIPSPPVVSYFSQDSFKVVGELTKGRTLTQDFPNPERHIRGLEIRFATYQRKLTSHYRVDLLEDGQVVRQVLVPAAAVGDSIYRWVPEDFTPQPGSHLAFQIESLDAQPGDALTVWDGSPNSAAPLTIDGKPAAEQLSFRVIVGPSAPAPATALSRL